MGIFSNNSAIKVYSAQWVEQGEAQRIDAEDASVLMPTAEVVKSTYGYSMKFVLRAGGQMYVPVSTRETVTVGMKVSLDNITISTLKKEGSDEIIYRVNIIKEAPAPAVVAVADFEL